MVRTRVRTSKDWNSLIPITYPRCTPPLNAPRATLPQIGSGVYGGTKFHHMVDCVDGLAYKDNPCFHEKYTARFAGQLLAINGSGVTSAILNSQTPVIVIEEARSLLKNRLTAEILDDFSAQSEQLFISPLPDGMSIVNAVIEIIDLLTMDIEAWKAFIKKWKNAVRRFFYRLNKEISIGRGIGSWWVAWRFAIRPTIKDAEKLLTSLSRARKALEWLRKVNHRVVSRYNRRKFPDLCTGDVVERMFSVPGYYGTWMDGNPPMPGIPPMKDSVPVQGVIRVTCEKSNVTLCATGRVRFDVSDALVDLGWAATGTAWMSMQWMYNPWAIVWEATPWSWAIDWCLSEKAKLERWKQFHETGDPYSLGVIQSACWSMKADLLLRVEFVQSNQDPRLIAMVRYRVYSRELGLPDAGSSWLRLPFSGYQLSIASGILEGRLRRR